MYYFRRHLWETIEATATVWVVLAAYYQLREGNKTARADSITSRADFIRRFSEKFFDDENTRDLLTLLDSDALIFEGEEYWYFSIQEDKVRHLGISETKKQELIARQRYSPFEVDDWLLGHFEAIAFFEREGLISIDHVYNEFDWHIETAWENEEIQKYIKASRKEDGDHIYEWFGCLVLKLKRHESKKKPHEKR